MRSRTQIIALVSLLTACGKDASGAEGSSGSPASRIEVPPGQVAGLRIRGEASGPGEVAPVIEAHGSAPVRVKRAISVERREGGRWSAVTVAGLSLRPDCEHEATDCVTLVEGAGLRPPAWNGKTDSGQCACRTCTSAPSGEYRFVLESCEGGARVPGEPFSLSR